MRDECDEIDAMVRMKMRVREEERGRKERKVEGKERKKKFGEVNTVRSGGQKKERREKRKWQAQITTQSG